MANNLDVVVAVRTPLSSPQQPSQSSNAEYQAYLQSDRWQKLRRVVMLRAKHQCEICLRRRGQHAAHLTYERIFHELPTDLVWVCQRCHADLDERQQKEQAEP